MSIIVIGSVIRSNETKKNKEEMFNQLKNYLEKYDDIPIELSYYWKIMVFLVNNNQKKVFFLLSKFIRRVFEKNWFRNNFRNQDYIKID